MTVFCVNNYNYGMTGGQMSPTTPAESLTTTTPYGNIEEPFDLSKLAIGAGAPYVARWTLNYPYETIQSMAEAIRTPGFGFIELLAPCPTGYGKENQLRDAKANWDWLADHTILRGDLMKLPPQERAKNRKFVIGKLWQQDRPEFTARWAEVVKRFRDED